MKVRTDDEMYRVDRTYLGPKGRRLPWRATYRAYGVWLGVVLLVGLVTFKLGVPITLTSVLIVLFLSVWLTIHIMKRLDRDRPLIALPIVVWHELVAPRPPTRRDGRTYGVLVRAKRSRPETGPPRRWWRRRPRRMTESSPAEPPVDDEWSDDDAA